MMVTAPRKRVQLSFVIRDMYERKHRGSVVAMQYDSMNGHLYSAGTDTVIRKWDVRLPEHIATNKQHGRYLDSMEHHVDWVNDLILCCSGRNLVSASSDTTLKIWNVEKGFCMSTLRTHKDYVRCLAYAKDVEFIASAGLDHCIYLWTVDTLTRLNSMNNAISASSFNETSNSIYSIAMNPTATILVSGSPENALRIWDPRNCVRICKLRGHSDNIRAITVNKDGTQCLSASSDGTVRLWSIGQQRCIASINCHSDSVWTLQADSNFSHVYSGGRDHRVYRTPLNDVSKSKLVLVEDSPIQKVLLGEEYLRHLYTATWNSSIKRWDMPADYSLSLRMNSVCDEPLMCHEPAFHIKGAPSIRQHAVLNDKRHIITKDTEGFVSTWDVLQARKVADHGKVEIDKIIKENNKKVFVPNWINNIDVKTGMLQITLDESEVFSAWTTAKDAGFKDRPPESRLNYGGMMLRSIFNKWPYSMKDDDEESPVGNYVPAPEHTPILLMEDTGKPVFRCTAKDMVNIADSEMQEFFPRWVLDIVEKNQFPKYNKIPFNLQKFPTISDKNPKKERLSATEMLTIRKVMEHVYDRIVRPAEQSEGTNGVSMSYQTQYPPALEQKVEIYCNNQKLEPDMDLRSVKHFVWKQAGDLIIQYKVIKGNTRFKKWSERLKEKKIEDESQRQRLEQVARLKEKLRRERELRDQADLLTDSDIEKLIEYLNAGNSLTAIPIDPSMYGLANGYPGYGDPYADYGNTQDRPKTTKNEERSDDDIFNEILAFYKTNPDHNIGNIPDTIANDPNKEWDHNHRFGEFKGVNHQAKLFRDFEYNRRVGS